MYQMSEKISRDAYRFREMCIRYVFIFCAITAIIFNLFQTIVYCFFDAGNNANRESYINKTVFYTAFSRYAVVSSTLIILGLTLLYELKYKYNFEYKV